MDKRSRELRRTIVRMLQKSGRGHIGAALSLVEILRVLYDDVLNYDPRNPKLIDRDRCILSKGHGCMALYAVLEDKGYFPESELWKFCKIDGLLGGHPEIKVPGVEASTGSLGHGMGIGIGIALNAKYHKSKYRVFVVIGDGESNEGSVWEAAMCASKHSLENFTVIVDYNKYQSYGCTSEVLELEPLADKWKSFGFDVLEVDGHDVNQLKSAFSSRGNRPRSVICHTVKGCGIEFIENNLQWHHKNKVSDEELNALFEALKD
ncbi:MAG: transketolase [Chloroflexi bacterium]|nr:transketolase [Chloroflexota bacterium]